MWLRLRFLVLRALAISVSLVPKPPQNMQTMNNGEAVPDFPLAGGISELKEVLQEVELHPGIRAKVQAKLIKNKNNFTVKTPVSELPSWYLPGRS